MNILINNYDVREKFEGVLIDVPPAVVLGTDVFDHFLDENNLRDFALNAGNDAEIMQRFVNAKKFSEEILGDLAAFLDLVREPLAVRSSSLLEDSQYHPFAGVYETYMIPNNSSDPFVRLGELVTTIKRVYASTFYQSAKDYIRVTSYRLEEEKMAVIIQRMVGSPHDVRFYPDFSGVAKSYNFYPIPPQKSQDGIVSMALGLGKQIVDGGMTVRFCPKYPHSLLQFSSPAVALKNNQNDFFALELNSSPLKAEGRSDVLLNRFSLQAAEEDETLRFVGSTYSKENDAIHDGLSRQGIRLVTFAPVLRQKLFPLAEIIELLLDMGTWGLGTPIEIEFAVKMSVPVGKPKEFGLLQIRPMVLSGEMEQLSIDQEEPARLLCLSNQVLGHGIIRDIHDVVVVDTEKFDRSKTLEVAREVTQLNSMLVSARRPFLLVGVGRWGSLDPWLGIPVKWDQIAGAKAIIEADFKDMEVAPSQGSHFFQNITSFMVGYFTVSSNVPGGFVDWNWLSNQRPEKTTQFVRLLHFKSPIVVKMNGHQNKGLILKPE